MIPERMQEFILMLLIENECLTSKEFSDYITEHYDTDKINNRYMELLDDFLTPYALDKTEKSDKHDKQLNTMYLNCEIFKSQP